MNMMLSVFSLFGVGYFVYFLLVAGMVTALVLCLRKGDENIQKIVSTVLVSLIALFMVLEFIDKVIGVKEIRIGQQLPFEIFDVFAVISIYYYFSKRSLWKKFGYLIILPVCLYSIIFVPNIYTEMQTISLGVISFYMLNGLLMANALLHMIWDAEDLEKKDILNVSINYVIIICAMHIVNVIFRFTTLGVHANYVGTMGETFDIIIEWLYSLINVPLLCLLPLWAILVGVEFLLVLPFDLIKTKKEKQSQIEELIALGNLKEQQKFREKHKLGKSQVLLRSEHKAMPSTKKDVSNVTKDGFVATNKEIKVNTSIEDKDE